MCKLRRAVSSDIVGILNTWEVAVRGTHDFLSKDEIIFYKDRMPEYLKSVELSVFESEGKIKGFSGVAGEELEMLFVAERGKGIGSQLLADAIGKGVNQVDVNEENGQAVGFYIAKGFRQGGRSQTDSDGKPHPILHFVLNQ